MYFLIKQNGSVCPLLPKVGYSLLISKQQYWSPGVLILKALQLELFKFVFDIQILLDESVRLVPVITFTGFIQIVSHFYHVLLLNSINQA